jgi:hypothetical protein
MAVAAMEEDAAAAITVDAIWIFDVWRSCFLSSVFRLFSCVWFTLFFYPLCSLFNCIFIQ